MLLVKSKAILQMTDLIIRNCNSFKIVTVNSFESKYFSKSFIQKFSKFESPGFTT